MKRTVLALRIFHGVIALYFIGCLIYIYYAAVVGNFDLWLVVALASLAVEGFVVFVLNGGDCPLIYLQRRVGDDKPFFELLLPEPAAKRAIPVFAGLAWIGAGLLAVRFLVDKL